ncbi:MAG TPA: hypothetical protein DCG19_00870 [Cryomorphaceae bacterium]|nr:hypothetical protein [Owenweeksia sp.]MBF97488.1 hypothetical protein [Owenweeksia sp.]HAD95919.1 hypothetical protein [Cryomorphaceae bacterium]HBF19990.1 hypothetical protein [Cryomorphaceae bacterium]HCQ14760.1 hypothetical protein [Cryomorphaceae bacterium]|tara:strand:- start:1082 stop:1393 length:312 start_codon:yes stop_codon:yes gene_type:complete
MRNRSNIQKVSLFNGWVILLLFLLALSHNSFYQNGKYDIPMEVQESGETDYESEESSLKILDDYLAPAAIVVLPLDGSFFPPVLSTGLTHFLCSTFSPPPEGC